MWDASKCNLCGDCLVRCQYIDYDKDKAVAEIKALMDSKEAEILSKCITCFACTEYCPTGADPFDLICKMQEKTGISSLRESPFWPTPSGLSDRLESPSHLIPGDPDKPVLSLGNLHSLIPEGALDGQLFQGMTVVKGGMYYCLFGIVHFEESFVEKYAQRFIDNYASLGKDIIFLHDDCYAMVHAKIKDYGISVPFKYMSLFEYLRNYLRDHRSSIIKLGKKVAYQRNCASRYTPGKDAFLDEIFELIGVERPPRKYDRETALCCGEAIVDVLPELAAEVQARNINDAIACGADALITYCPACHHALQQPTSQFGLTHIYITDLCRMALGEKPWPAQVS
jgi:Fe-S oxidoreductase